jgi:hypothetical protein
MSLGPADHAKNLASQVDTLAHFEVNDQSTQTFLQEFLGSDECNMSFKDAWASLACIKPTLIQPAHKYLAAMAHIIF